MGRKYLIPNATSQNNTGDAAMLTVLITLIREADPYAQIVVHSSEPESYAAYVDVIVRPSIYYWAVFDDSRLWARIVRLLMVIVLYGLGRLRLWLPFDWTPIQLMRDYREADTVVMVGGGYLSTKPGFTQSLNLLMSLSPVFFSTLSRGLKLVAPVSVGPFAYPWQAVFTSWCLSRMDVVSVREHLSYALMTTHGVKKTLLSNDHALLLERVANKTTKKRVVGFTIRPWLNEEGTEWIVRAYVAGLASMAAKGYDIQPIIQVRANFHQSDDVPLTQVVIDRLAKQHILALEPLYVTDVTHAQQVYGNLHLLIGMRMHSNIIAATQGVPFVAVSYEYKTEGICHALSMDDWCIRCTDLEAATLVSKLDDLDTRHTLVRTQMLDQLSNIQRMEKNRWQTILKRPRDNRQLLLNTPKINETKGVIRIFSKCIINRVQHDLWVAVEGVSSSFIAKDATAFASCLLLPSMRANLDLVIEGSVSKQWTTNIRLIMQRVLGWGIRLNPISVFPRETREDTYSGKAVGLFFSAGVDSFSSLYSYLKHPEHPVSHLVFVQGMDIELENDLLFAESRRRIEEIAQMYDLKLIVVKTNARELTDKILSWDMAHGGVLAMVGQLLRGGLRAIIIPGSGFMYMEEPWGSSSQMDHLWSTETLRVIHNHDTLKRLEKISHHIATQPVALNNLRVCWRNREYNCCVCEKCLCAMIDLALAGVLDKAVSFHKPLDLDLVSKIRMTPYTNMIFLEQSLAELLDRDDLTNLKDALLKSVYLSYHLPFFSRLKRIVHDIDAVYNEGRLFVLLIKLSSYLQRLHRLSHQHSLQRMRFKFN